MKLLRNMRIQHRMWGLFAVWLILFIVFAVVAFRNVSEIGQVSEDIYTQSLRTSNAAREAKVAIMKIHRGIRELLLLNNVENVYYESDKIKELDNQVLENFEIIESNSGNNGEIKQLISEAAEIFDEWRKSRADIVVLIQENKHLDEITELTAKNNEFVEELEKRLDNLDKIEENEALSLINRSAKIQAYHKNSIFYWTGIIVFISVVLFTIVIRSIIWPISYLQHVMQTSANTRELIEADLTGKNELVNMANYYNKLVRNLKEQFWIKDSCSSLNEKLAGKFDLTEITDKAVTFLASIMDAGNGVLYLYNDEDKKLYLNSSYAFTERDRLSNQYELGEGIIGQVALERKPILLKNVKRHEALITTGTVSEAPLNIYAMPLLYQGHLYGVLELSSFEPFVELKQELMNEAARIISTYLYTAVQNNRIVNLLKITEAAKQEAGRKASELEEANRVLEEQQILLQKQTEELQQTNIQLEDQQQKLQQQSEELQQTNSQLEEQQQLLEEQARLLNVKNEDLEKTTRELRLRTEELEKVNKYRTEFLTNMSHELRTPLNSIILLSKMLGRKKISEINEKDMEKVEVINKAGQELLRLINDVLDLSKVESGKMNLNIFTFHSSELMEDLRQMFEGSAKEKNISFVVEDSINSMLVGDRDKISQILRNFLSNSFKFTAEGSIILKAAVDKDGEGGAVFSVTDTGIGISEEHLSVIFQEFKQVDGTISRKYGGTGLGLSISKKLASLMNGEIEVSSKVGEGSTFSLKLPGLIKKINVRYAAGLKQDMDKKALNTPKNGKTILVIEDNADFAKYIREINDSMGFDTIMAGNGKEGLEIAKNTNVDGILLDIILPDMCGVEVLREIKSTVELRKIPVHVISALEEDDVLKIMAFLLNYSAKNSRQILVVGGDTVWQNTIKKLFEDKSIAVKVVSTENQAKFELKKNVYDAVILNVELKDRDGINICKYIDEQNMDIPLIVYTQKDFSREQQEEIRKYADRIIIKTANSEKRLQDELTNFLMRIKENVDSNCYLFSKMKREYALSLKEKTIMIVDDDHRNVFVLASALEDYGATIIAAENGKVALELLGSHKVDLILMDIMMPVMDGYETIRAIRKDEKLKDIPIIAVTAKSLKADREKCIEAGADDYISKPVDYDVLIRLIKAWIAKEN
ncbi:response regulator [Acetivibrio straminisolvens]|jgi:signal transduction histidine kinase/DNA-binding response OmpR family regulator|uniref:response regulator n=1 Tax=Acetivibrio straminisolvens TaxID=253314 RepID=UPI00223FE446|nr:response regulator [Acetivibrio straminisolvens]